MDRKITSLVWNNNVVKRGRISQVNDSSCNAEVMKEVDDVGFLASLSAGVIGLSASVLESGTRNYLMEPKATSRSCVKNAWSELPILAIITITLSLFCDASYAT
jgi:hypothetical protein